MMRFFNRREKRTAPAAAALPSHKSVKRSYYAGAKTDRLTAGWSGVTASADASVFASLTRARARARQLAADNDYVRRFFKMVTTNVVGPQGMQLQVRAVEREDASGVVYDDRANAMIETAWAEWGRVKNCTVDKRLSLVDVKQLAVETVAKDGEIFIRKVRGKAAGNDFGFALQLIEADHVDENFHATMSSGNRVRMGIEFNEWNAPVAYHVLTRHPGETLGAHSIAPFRERIPASDMLHLFRMERPSMSRGMPWVMSAMRRMRLLGVYEENELVASGVAASKMGFFTQDGDQQYEGSGKDESGNPITDAEPGIFEMLPAGVKFEGWDPQHPTTAFGEFVKSMLRGAASGLGVNYNILANDLEGVSYSSIRQGTLDDRELWKIVQKWLIEHFCDDVFESWLLMALTMQKIPLPLNKFEKFNKPVWRPRGWQWIDPLKEVNSNIAAIKAGFVSAQDVASQQGMDIEDVYAQLAQEQKLREKHGLKFEAALAQDTTILGDQGNGSENGND